MNWSTEIVSMIVLSEDGLNNGFLIASAIYSDNSKHGVASNDARRFEFDECFLCVFQCPMFGYCIVVIRVTFFVNDQLVTDRHRSILSSWNVIS